MSDLAHHPDVTILVNGKPVDRADLQHVDRPRETPPGYSATDALDRMLDASRKGKA